MKSREEFAERWREVMEGLYLYGSAQESRQFGMSLENIRLEVQAWLVLIGRSVGSPSDQATEDFVGRWLDRVSGAVYNARMDLDVTRTPRRTLAKKIRPRLAAVEELLNGMYGQLSKPQASKPKIEAKPELKIAK